MPGRAPPERTSTARARLRQALAEGEPLTLRELSQLAGLSEKVLPDHLEHLRKSVKADGGRLIVDPAECLGCGFVFEGRRRFTRPGKCPECRGSRIVPPTVRLESP